MTKQITKNPNYLLSLTYERKRKIVESAFAGTDAQGNRFGVYISESEDPKTLWLFKIQGLFEGTVASLPLTDHYLEDTFGLDPQYQDVKKELDSIKTNFASSKPTVGWCKIILYF